MRRLRSPASSATSAFPSPKRASSRVYEFAFIMQPMKLKGGIGSTVAPIAIR